MLSLISIDLSCVLNILKEFIPLKKIKNYQKFQTTGRCKGILRFLRENGRFFCNFVTDIIMTGHGLEICDHE